MTALVDAIENKVEAYSIMSSSILTAAHRASSEIEIRRTQYRDSNQSTGAEIYHVGYRKSVWSPYGMAPEGLVGLF